MEVCIITDNSSVLKVKYTTGDTLQQLLLKLNYDIKLVKAYKVPVVSLWIGCNQFLQLPELSLTHKLIDTSIGHVILIRISHDHSSYETSKHLLSVQSKTDEHLLEMKYDIPYSSVQQEHIAENKNVFTVKDDDVIIIEEDDDVITDHQFTVTCCGVTLSGNDLSTLNPGQWLNDQVINGYMKLLMYHNKDVYITSTFFYTKLRRSGYKGILKWIYKINIFRYSKILIPIHLSNHWSLIVIDIQYKRIEYYDSLGISGNTIMKHIQYLIMKIAKYEKRSEKWNSWRRTHPKNIPRQHNSSDCGIYICQYAKWICKRGNPFSLIPSFSSKKMRELMITEMKNELIIPFLRKEFNKY